MHCHKGDGGALVMASLFAQLRFPFGVLEFSRNTEPIIYIYIHTQIYIYDGDPKNRSYLLKIVHLLLHV